MVLDDAPPPGHAALAHVRRHPFVYLSVALHAAAFAAFGFLDYSGHYRIDAAQLERSVETGTRLTERARLEKRVHDMARIKSLLDKDTAAGKQDDVQFSAQPRSPDELLAQARALARAIDGVERDAKAEELAKLLHIPKEKALEQVAAAPPLPAPKDPAQAAAQIEQLETRARQALEQRRQQLERQQNGTPVTADEQRPADAGAGAGARAGTGTGGVAPQGEAGGAPGTGTGQGNFGGVSGAQVLAGIRAFTNPDLPDRATQAYTTGRVNIFDDGGSGSVPAVDTAAMVKGAGRMIGAGGTYANRVYVNRWYLIGPFDGKHGDGLFSNYRHPPEDGVVLDAVYRGKHGRAVRWEYVDTARYPLMPPTAAEDAVYYGYTELMSDRERDVTFWVGADDDAQLWLNDRLVWRGGDPRKQWFFSRIYDIANTYARDYNLSEGKRVVHLRQGRNKLFFKLSNGPTRLFFSLVVTK